MLRFSDGMTFDTSGPLRLECRSDGWYVVGQGMMMAVKDPIIGQETIERLTSTMPLRAR